MRDKRVSRLFRRINAIKQYFRSKNEQNLWGELYRVLYTHDTQYVPAGEDGKFVLSAAMEDQFQTSCYPLVEHRNLAISIPVFTVSSTPKLRFRPRRAVCPSLFSTN